MGALLAIDVLVLRLHERAWDRVEYWTDWPPTTGARFFLVGLALTFGLAAGLSPTVTDRVIDVIFCALDVIFCALVALFCLFDIMATLRQEARQGSGTREVYLIGSTAALRVAYLVFAMFVPLMVWIDLHRQGHMVYRLAVDVRMLLWVPASYLTRARTGGAGRRERKKVLVPMEGTL